MIQSQPESPRQRARMARTTALLLLSRLQRAHKRALRRGLETMSLGQLEDSRRPLLFALLPRMLRSDGSTPESLQGAFGYIDQGGDRAPAIIVSSQRWTRALATSRKLAAARVGRGKKP